jgi:hypothetical protein
MGFCLIFWVSIPPTELRILVIYPTRQSKSLEFSYIILFSVGSFHHCLILCFGEFGELEDELG